MSSPCASGDGVVPGAAVDRQLYGSGGKASSIDDVVASTAVDDELIVGALGAGEGDGSRQTGNADQTCRSRHLNGVVAGGAVDGHAIGRAIANVAARCRREVDRNLRDTGAGEVADRDVVGAAASGEVDVLDAVEIHGDVADVARELHPSVVRGDVDFLVDVRAIEHQRVGAVTAVDRVAAVARIPDEGVVAAAELRIVVAAAADDDVVACAADQRVVAVAAGDGVVAVAAVEGEVDQARKPVAGSDSIVTAAGVKHKILGGADVEGKRRRADAVEAHAGAVGGDGECFGAVAAVDFRGVVAVAALHEVGALARVPDHEVVPGLAEHLVVAGTTDQRVVAVAAEQQIVTGLTQQRVVAGAAEQLIVARAADQRVVARAAEQLGGGQRAIGFVERDHVVAARAEHLDQGGVGDRRRAARDSDRAAIDEDRSGRIAANDDRVVEVIVEHR